MSNINSTPPVPAFKIKRPITSQVLRILVYTVTLPYHRFFLYNTLRPTEIIEKWAPHGTEDGSIHREKMCGLLRNWRQRKKGELDFISIAGVAVTAIVTATLSWESVASSHWIGVGFFYASLIVSIIGILLSAQQNTLLTLLGDINEDWRLVKQRQIEGYLTQLLSEDKSHKHPVDSESHHHQTVERRHKMRCWRVSWQMVFVWQIPMMAVGYSFLFYIIGLSTLICTPLIREEWGDNQKIAVVYLTFSALSWGIFIYCSLFGYRRVALYDDEEEEDDEVVNEATGVATIENVRQSEIKSS